MNNLDMFDNPNYGRNDRRTSVAAGESITALGSRSHSCLRVLALVAEYPGSTQGELSLHSFDKYRGKMPARSAMMQPIWRIKDLYPKGLVQEGPERPCRDTKQVCLTWNITPAGLHELILQAGGEWDL